MSWFKRLLGSSPPPPPPAGPAVVELVPGKLTARVYTHNFPVGSHAIPCWTYITQGFLPLGQKEFAFTLVRGPKDDPAAAPSDPLQFFAQIYPLAEQKQFVDAGGYTCFQTRAGSFLGVTGMVGFVYSRPELIAGVDLPPTDQFLNAIFLVPGEAEMVQAGWSYRVLARLGRETRYFPHPPWSDPRRAPVLTRDELQVSVLGKMPTVHFHGAFVRMFLAPTVPPAAGETGGSVPLSDRLLLRIQSDRLPQVRELLSHFTGSEGAFALLFSADPEANVRLTWLPGDKAPSTITPTTGDASCLTGGFLAVVFGPGVAGGGRMTEDGFSFMLNSDSWSRLRAALTNGEPITLPQEAGELALSVEWIRGVSQASEASEKSASPFRVNSVVLYQPDEILNARLPSAKSIGELVLRVESAASEFWSTRPVGTPQPVLVVLAIKPGGRMRVWVDVPAAQGAEEGARELTAHLERLPAPVVQHGPVAFAIQASLWDGAGEWPFIPKEWKAAAEGRESMLVPDGILERIWPE